MCDSGVAPKLPRSTSVLHSARAPWVSNLILCSLSNSAGNGRGLGSVHSIAGESFGQIMLAKCWPGRPVGLGGGECTSGPAWVDAEPHGIARVHWCRGPESGWPGAVCQRERSSMVVSLSRGRFRCVVCSRRWSVRWSAGVGLFLVSRAAACLGERVRREVSEKRPPRLPPGAWDDEDLNTSFSDPAGRYPPSTVETVRQLDERFLQLPLIAAVLAMVASWPNPGGVLVFLPGWQEILACAEVLNKDSRLRCYDIIRLHSTVPPAEQQRALWPSGRGKRKAILATDIAETSITIPDVLCVVDCGVARVKHHSSLELVWISKAVAVAGVFVAAHRPWSLGGQRVPGSFGRVSWTLSASAPKSPPPSRAFVGATTPGAQRRSTLRKPSTPHMPLSPPCIRAPCPPCGRNQQDHGQWSLLGGEGASLRIRFVPESRPSSQIAFREPEAHEGLTAAGAQSWGGKAGSSERKLVLWPGRASQWRRRNVQRNEFCDSASHAGKTSWAQKLACRTKRSGCGLLSTHALVDAWHSGVL